ncbi:MAG: protein kinase, partial [Acidimicrobiales bacterium]
MEYVAGPDLRRRLDAGPCSVTEVLGLGHRIADGLEAAHRAGLVHRDVKPANVLCTVEGHPKLGDFGIATASAGDRTATGIVLGTAKYLAPEQVRGGPIDARTDVYALCVVLYEAVSGRPPFERAGELATAMARLEEAPTPPSRLGAEVPAELESIVMRGLALDPAHRWPSAGSLRDALDELAGRLGEQPSPLAVGGLQGPTPATTPGRSPSADTTVAAATTGDPRHVTATIGEPVDVTTAEGIASPPQGPTGTRRRHLRRWPTRVALAVAGGAIGWLGWTLVTDGDPVGDLVDGIEGLGSFPSLQPTVASVAAFDPEGTGPAGEHDDLAALVVDGDPATIWPTERYDARDLGPKRGVGLVFELEEESRIGQVAIVTRGDDWAAEIYVADGASPTLAGWGAAIGRVESAGPETTVTATATGRAVLVWFTDLGRGPTPIRLEVAEITIA